MPRSLQAVVVLAAGAVLIGSLMAPGLAVADCGGSEPFLVATWPVDGASDMPAGFPIRVLLPKFWELNGFTVNGVDVNAAEFVTEPDTDYEVVIRGTPQEGTETEMGRISFSTGNAAMEIVELPTPELLGIDSVVLGDSIEGTRTPCTIRQIPLGCYDVLPIEYFQPVVADWSHPLWGQDALVFETEISGIVHRYGEERTDVFSMLGCPATPIYSSFFLSGTPCLRVRVIAPNGDTSEWSESVCTTLQTPVVEGGVDAGPTPPDAGETDDAQPPDTNSDAATDSTTDDTESESGCSTTRPQSGVSAALLALAALVLRRRRG